MARRIADILAGTKSWQVRHGHGQVIFGEGEPSRTMYLVESGCVRLQLNAASGDRHIVAFLFPGDLFGFSLKERTVAAEAVTDVILRCWSNAGVLNLSLRSKAVTMALINAGDSMFTSLAHRVETVSSLAAKDRFLWFVDGMTRCPGVKAKDNTIRVPMSRRDIADYLDMKPETLSRAIDDLEVQGTLKRQGRQAFVLRRPNLALGG
ncbi:MAG: Crp/Fnr family transcriptional regulator [Hyphomonadaceae bacterium]